MQLDTTFGLTWQRPLPLQEFDQSFVPVSSSVL